MSDKAEIKATLVLDDKATKAANDFKKAMEGAAHAEHKANEEGEKLNKHGKGRFAELKEMGMHALEVSGGMALAEGMAEGFSKAKEMASELYGEVAAITIESDNQIRSLAGVLSMLDEQGNAYEDVYARAGDLKDELEGIGIEAGVSADAVTSAFQQIYERGGKTIEQTEELTEKMTQAGRLVPGGIQAIASGFNAVELGVVRARNPLVQMISSMGILHGNAKSVAAQMMKMSPEKQMELAEKALSKMGDKAKSMPLSFEQAMQSLRDIKDNMMEALGTPVLAKLTEQLSRFQNYVMDHRDEIGRVLESFGKHIGELVDFMGDIFGTVDEIVQDNAADLKAIWADLTIGVRTEWDAIMGNQESVRDAMKDVATTLIQTTRVLADLFKSIHEIIGDTMAMTAVALKNTPGMQGKGAAMEQGLIQGQLKASASSVEGMDPHMLDAVRQQYIEDAALLNQDAAKANADFTAAYAGHAEVVQDVTKGHVAAITASAGEFGAAFDWAAGKHNEAAEKNIAEFVAGNQNIQTALLMAGPEIIKSGQKGFIDALKETGQAEFADKLQKEWAPKMGATPGAMNVNFNGNTFNVKQDFRDQDPERVAVAFKKGMGHEAAARTMSRFASPFGF